MAFQMKNGKWKGQVYYTDRNGKVHRKTKNFDRKRDALQWQNEECKRLELADQEAETKQKSFKELKVGEWAELYMEYAFNTFTEENCKLAKEKQRAFKRFFETKVISPEVHVSSVRRKTFSTYSIPLRNSTPARTWIGKSKILRPHGTGA